MDMARLLQLVRLSRDAEQEVEREEWRRTAWIGWWIHRTIPNIKYKDMGHWFGTMGLDSQGTLKSSAVARDRAKAEALEQRLLGKNSAWEETKIRGR